MSAPDRLFYFEAFGESGRTIYSGPLEELPGGDSISTQIKLFTEGHPYVRRFVLHAYERVTTKEIPVDRSPEMPGHLGEA